MFRLNNVYYLLKKKKTQISINILTITFIIKKNNFKALFSFFYIVQPSYIYLSPTTYFKNNYSFGNSL